jgi:hypothetical protein
MSAGATMLAGFGVSAPLRCRGSCFDHADARRRSRGPTVELAQYRPMSVSSTDYAPTPAEFAVDAVASVGVKGTGRRAAQGDP